MSRSAKLKGKLIFYPSFDEMSEYLHVHIKIIVFIVVLTVSECRNEMHATNDIVWI